MSPEMLDARLKDVEAQLHSLNGLVMMLLEENDTLLVENRLKESCILALTATVDELQQAIRVIQ